MKLAALGRPALVGAALLYSLSAHSTLTAVDLDGNATNGHEGVYDDVLDITWLANANLAVSNDFGVPLINSSGVMKWGTAQNFVTAMNTNSYLGVTTWRQPTVAPVNGTTLDITDFTYDGSSDRSYQLSASVDATYNQSGQSSGFTGSELAYHYYNNFDAIGACSGVGTDNTYGCVSDSEYGIDDANNAINLALFSNIQNNTYWTGTELDSSRAFRFGTNFGTQTATEKGNFFYVWAVAPGNVAANAVPVPGAVWLFGSALMGLAGLARRR